MRFNARLLQVVPLLLVSTGCNYFLGLQDPTDSEFRDAGESKLAPVADFGRSCKVDEMCSGTPCCKSVIVRSGDWRMGRSAAGTDACPDGLDCGKGELPEHTARTSPYYLDVFEVTVGRYRRFIKDYERWRSLGNPIEDAGQQPHIGGSGWQPRWNDLLPDNEMDFENQVQCSPDKQTYTKGDDLLPINCLTFYQAFAFCVWDFGRLPTEAEWELAAAAGDENRLYPWPGTFMETYLSTTPVRGGSYPLGVGRWGHYDLAGSVYEWTLDQDDGYGSGICVDCGAVGAAFSSGWDQRIARGGSTVTAARAAWRYAYPSANIPPDGRAYFGVRCARDH